VELARSDVYSNTVSSLLSDSVSVFLSGQRSILGVTTAHYSDMRTLASKLRREDVRENSYDMQDGLNV
jgi:hypothetical protein